MKLGVVNKSTTVSRFVFHTLLRNLIVQKTSITLDILKGGGKSGKEPIFLLHHADDTPRKTTLI